MLSSKPHFKNNSRITTFLSIISISILSSCARLNASPVPSGPVNEKDALAIHNKLRALHHAPKLTWDTTLAKYAERHARRCRFQHSNGPYGENLAAGYPSLSVALNSWYEEQRHYSYWNPGFSHSTGHFTQMVWKATNKLGCGYAICDGKNNTPGKFWVCEYSPRGNIINRGYFQANVLAR